MKLLSAIIITIGITISSFQINALDSKGKVLENSLNLSKKQTVRESKTAGISLMFGGGALLGASFNYTVIPNIDLDLYLGLMNGGAIKFYTNRDSSWNFYLGAGASASFPFPMMNFFWMINAPLGIEYIGENGFQFSFELGVSYIFIDEYYDSDHDKNEGMRPAEEKLLPMAGLKLGYSF